MGGDRWPREIEEHSNQHFAKGLCYGLGIAPSGRPFALIEYEGGTVKVRYLDEHYSVEFV